MGVAAAAPIDLVLLLGSLVGRTAAAAAAVHGRVGDGVRAAADDQLAVQEEAEVVLAGGRRGSQSEPGGGDGFRVAAFRRGNGPVKCRQGGNAS